MALVVEDGTGLSTAESYISVADADTYIGLYKGADATWDAASTTDKEIAARQATQYLDGRYNWKGQIELSTQALDWPRIYVYDETGKDIDGLPVAVANATAEVMFLIIGGTAITENVTRGKQIKRRKTDVLETEYEPGASVQPSFPTVSRLLSGLTIPGGRVSRA